MKQDLLEILDTIEGNGSFFTKGILDFVLPGLVIDGVGEVGFPINESMAKTLIKSSKQAPYGQGVRTIVDTSVRNTWEIDASKMKFENPNWNQYIHKINDNVKEGLGLENVNVEAHLYKLLIYEKDGFFLSHKDSEKENGMFGTLVINLPSEHTGGELIIRFDDKEETVDFSSISNQYEAPYVAFYADCEHEIKPLISGYRFCLIYNLIQSGETEFVQNPSYFEQTQELIRILKKSKPLFSKQPKAIILEHEYTPANFSLSSLKLHDKPRVLALKDAAERAGYFAELGLMTKYEMGDAEYDGGYGYYDDLEIGGMEEVIEDETYVEQWGDSQQPGLGKIGFSDDDIISVFALGEGEPHEEENGGYTGNAGVTLEYWYYYGALVIWPKEHHLDIVNQQDVDVKLDWLGYWSKDLNEFSEQAINIIENLGKDDCQQRYQKKDFGIVVKILAEINDAVKVRRQFTLLGNIFDAVSPECWTGLLCAYDLTTFDGFFSDALQANKISHIKTYLQIMEKLACSKDTKYRDFVRNELKFLPAYFGNVGMDNKKESNTAIEIVRDILALHNFYDENTNRELTKILSSLSKRNFVNNVLTTNLIALDSLGENKLAIELFAFCEGELKKRTAIKSVPPSNMRKAVPQGNSHRHVWEKLTRFLESETENVFDYKARKSERENVEYAIRNVTIDLKMQTITQGSPHTLRLTKTQASYERKLKIWKEDCKLLEKLLRVKD